MALQMLSSATVRGNINSVVALPGAFVDANFRLAQERDTIGYYPTRHLATGTHFASVQSATTTRWQRGLQHGMGAYAMSCDML